MKIDRCCQFCKKTLSPGTPFYECNTKIISGFDGCLPRTEQSLESIVEEILRETEGRNSDELMKDVYQEFCFVLCNDCRLLFRDRLQAMMGEKRKILPFATKRKREER